MPTTIRLIHLSSRGFILSDIAQNWLKLTWTFIFLLDNFITYIFLWNWFTFFLEIWETWTPRNGSHFFYPKIGHKNITCPVRPKHQEPLELVRGFMRKDRRMPLVKHCRRQRVESWSWAWVYVCVWVEDTVLRPGCVLHYSDAFSVAWRNCLNGLL